MTSAWTIERDLQIAATHLKDDLRSLDGARIFLTGGTGFIGTWILELFRYAVMTDKCKAEIVVLTRDVNRFAQKAPHLATCGEFTFIEGDVQDFRTPEGKFTHVIHGATDASADLNQNNPLAMFQTVVKGTSRVLEVARVKDVSRVLHLSSGAVYGKQPWNLTHVPEDYIGAPSCTDPLNSYAEAKRASEMLCSIYTKQFGLSVSIARIFALLGPYLSLDIHFAAGNFIRDAMRGEAVVVQGDGRPHRSYLYASDLVVWLIALLTRGDCGKAYNVGSAESISIADLARRISGILGTGAVKVLGSSDAGWNTGRYVPRTDAIEASLGVKQTVHLDEAIRRTAQWNGWKQCQS